MCVGKQFQDIDKSKGKHLLLGYDYQKFFNELAVVFSQFH